MNARTKRNARLAYAVFAVLVLILAGLQSAALAGQWTVFLLLGYLVYSLVLMLADFAIRKWKPTPPRKAPTCWTYGIRHASVRVALPNKRRGKDSGQNLFSGSPRPRR